MMTLTSDTLKDGNGNQVLTTGAESLQTGLNVGYGSDSDSQSSQTKAGINTQNLTVRNEQAQLEKTGKTAEQIKEDVKTDITTETAENHSGKLENRFDKDKLQKELNYQVQATQAFQTTTMATINEKVASHAESKRAEAEQAKAEGNTIKAQELENEAEKWETGGTYRQGVDALTNAVGLALGGSPNAGVVTGAISPYINTEIKKATQNNKEANLIAHAVWGAVEAYTQGGKAGVGAVAAVTGEVGADIIAQNLFGKKPENLTEAEKRTVSELSQVAAGLAGGLSASSGDSLSTAQAVKTGQEVGKNAVENNFLSDASSQRFNELVLKRSRGEELTEKEKFEILELAYFDQESDVLVKTLQRGEQLTTLEKQNLDRFIERYLNETVSGRINSGRGQKYTRGTNLEVANLFLGEKYLNNVGYKPNYSYPYVFGDTNEWRNKSDWKADEIVYREVFNELNNRPRLPQTWQELAQEMQNAVVAKGRGRIPNATNFSIRVPKNIAKQEQAVVVPPKGYEKQTTDLRVSTGAENAALYPKLKLDLATEQNANRVIDSLKTTGQLPAEYVTKEVAESKYGWQKSKPFKQGQIGGDVFLNSQKLLPEAEGRIWKEADIGIDNNVGRNKQEGTRLLYSNDGLLFITTDHYQSFKEIGKWK